jgi:hypothetical protein
MDWGLKAGHAKPFMEILWRLDWFVSNVFQQEKIDSKLQPKLPIQYLYSIKKKLKRH